MDFLLSHGNLMLNQERPSCNSTDPEKSKDMIPMNSTDWKNGKNYSAKVRQSGHIT